MLLNICLDKSRVEASSLPVISVEDEVTTAVPGDGRLFNKNDSSSLEDVLQENNSSTVHDVSATNGNRSTASLHLTSPTPASDNLTSPAPVNKSHEGCSDPVDLGTQYAHLLQQSRLALITIPEDIPLNASHQYYQSHFIAPELENCPDVTPEELTSVDPNVRSLCPWRTVNNTDTSRFPETMQFVQCECSNCREVQGGQCEVIWRNTLVLRRDSVCIDGLYLYKPVYQPVSVACVCAKQRKLKVTE